MNTLLMLLIGLFFAYALYMASINTKHFRQPIDFLNANQELPPWVFLFTTTGIIISSLGLYDHLLLSAHFGLQFNHVGMGLLILAGVTILFMKRLWLVSRISGLKTAGDILAGYYSSETIRIYVFVLLVLFAIPFAGKSLFAIGILFEVTTAGVVDRHLATWGMAFFLFLYSCIGGWRAVVFIGTAQTIILLALLMFFGVYSFAEFGNMPAIMSAITATTDATQTRDILYDRIPGVIQFTNGLGKEISSGGVWTTAGIFSYGLALTGIVLSPAFCLLSISARNTRGFAFQPVWMSGGLAAGLLLLLSPLLGLELARLNFFAAPSTSTGDLYFSLIQKIADFDQVMGVLFVFMLLVSLQIAVSFFATAGANIFSLEIFSRFIHPGAPDLVLKKCARVGLFVIFFIMALLASSAPLSLMMLGDLALSLSAQLIPAFLGLCWLSWISRQGVLVGLILGLIFVVFTEPIGIVPFGNLFVELPWGRWPWTIHSAGWGLAVNLLSCLLVSSFTKKRDNREHRNRLHTQFSRACTNLDPRPNLRTALWSLTLLWVFFALGPGAILGNDLFALPILSDQAVDVGMPSIWVWQVVFWIVGVIILWWMVHQLGIRIGHGSRYGQVALIENHTLMRQGTIPKWIRLFLERFTTR